MPEEPKTVRLLKSGIRLVVEPTTLRIAGLLKPELTFEQKIFLRGRELYAARSAGLPIVHTQEWECFFRDHKNRIATTAGFIPRLRDALREAGYAVVVEDLLPHPKPEVLIPRWERVHDGANKFLYKQEEALSLIVAHERGRIDCFPGWGKGTLIRMACQLFPKAKIVVATRRVQVLQQRLYPELSLNLPSVGIVGGGRRITGRRVMCYTLDSIGHADFDADFVFVDEIHEAASDKHARNLARFRRARMWGLSATNNKRFDGKDLRCEGLCGPVRLSVPYQIGVEQGMVVPILVKWRRVALDVDPCSNYTGTAKKRHGIWRNRDRNELIAEDARGYDPDVQTLITVDTLEHGLYLRKLLPEFTLVYRPEPVDLADREKWLNRGLITEDERMLVKGDRDRLTDAFSSGDLKKVIATPIWNVGVNFLHLRVLIRTDGGSSEINDTQIPGRVSRLGKDGKKVVGIVHDYIDRFNTGLLNNSSKRRRHYREQGWEQADVDIKPGSLQQRMLWD